MEHFGNLVLKLSVNERVNITVADLVAMNLDGCIAGSCVLSNDFSTWESEPDVDFFAYNATSWTYAVTYVLAQDRYEAGSKKDEWKLSRIAQGRNGHRGKFITQTIYLKDTMTGIYVNLSYKPGASNVMDVLSRFDTVAIMVGICCRTRVKVDLRKSFHPLDYVLSVKAKGDANPIRLWYLAEGWDEGTWSRELSRIKKYADRGFNMKSMAKSMLNVAARVLQKGEVIGSEKSKSRYLNLMLSCYRPTVWLENFIDPEGKEGNDLCSTAIFTEIIKLVDGLPKEVIDSLLADITTPLVPCGDKQFSPEEEQEEEEILDEGSTDR